MRRDNVGTLEKRCGRCKQFLPADSEFFYQHKREPDGLYDWCKACYVEWFNARKSKRRPT